jgi:phosphatidylglycerophosphatase A
MYSPIAALISSGLGSGYAPKAPGTFGTVAAALAWLGMSWSGILSSSLSHIVCAAIAILVGTAAIRVSLRSEGSSEGCKDPQWIVIDEWAGLFVALIGTEASRLWHVLLAILLFRIFDISKVGPIRRAEALPGAVGVMADDVVAGVFALVGMVAMRSFV